MSDTKRGIPNRPPGAPRAIADDHTRPTSVGEPVIPSRTITERPAPLPKPRPPRRTPAPPTRERHPTLIMSRPMIKALALEWFKQGFARSGHRFHGESRAATHPGMVSMLETEFERAWSERDRGVAKSKVYG